MRRKLTGDYVVQCYVLEGNGNPGNLGRLICYCQWKELVQLRMPTETRRETKIERDRATALLNAGLYMAKTSCFSLLASRKAKMLKKRPKLAQSTHCTSHRLISHKNMVTIELWLNFQFLKDTPWPCYSLETPSRVLLPTVLTESNSHSSGEYQWFSNELCSAINKACRNPQQPDFGKESKWEVRNRDAIMFKT